MKNIFKRANLQTKIYLIAILIIFIKTQSFYFMTGSAENIWLPIITVGMIGLFLMPILFIKKTKRQINYGLIVDILITILLATNAIYYKYSNNFLSMFQIINAKYGSEIMSALPTLIKPYHLIFILDFIIYLIYRKKINKLDDKRLSIKQRGILVLLASVLGMFSITYAYFKPEKNLKERFWSKNTLIAQSTIFGYHYYDFVNFFNGNKNIPYKSFEELYNSFKEEVNSKHTVEPQEKYLDIDEIAKGKNVILLQLEAIQNFIIGESINGKEITPNLNKWFAENIHFTNMHSQGLGTTADSEHSVLNSLYPLENGSVYQFYAKNKYYNILNEPQKSGYYTSFMHANVKGFWNRFNVYSNVGVNVFEDIEAFKPIDEWINCWPSDEEFFTEGIEKLKSYPKPFITNMVAVSSHYPFTLNGIRDKEKKVNIDITPYQDTLLGNYMETANYVDYAFGKFIQGLKDSGLYDDTVIIVYGDHYAMNIDDKNMLEYMESIGKPLNKIRQKVNYTNVACGMSIPGVGSMVITDPVGKLDIKPTVYKMLGLKDTFSFGNNMFDRSSCVNISNYNIITREDMYVDGKWYNIETGEELINVPESKQKVLDTHVDNMTKEVQMSESIIKKDLLKDEEKVEELYNELNEYKD